MKRFFGVLTLLLITLTGKVFAAGNEILIVRVAQNSSLMVQVNSAMDPMTIDSISAGGTFSYSIGGPVKPGAEFILVDKVSDNEKNFGLRSILTKYEQPTLQSTNRRIKPTGNARKIALIYDSINLYSRSQDELDSYKKSKMFKNTISKCLKNAISMYAGTEWEPLLNAELEEWK